VGLKEDVRALLESGEDRLLAAAIAGDPRVARLLVPRLWDNDVRVSERAAAGLGECAVLWPEVAREIVRRLLWALNDESATNGQPALAGLGEIGRRAPLVMAPYVSALAAFADDDGLREDLLKAFAAIAEQAPHLVVPHLEALERAADRSRQGERAALEALLQALPG
jgi:hypothetical protein